MIAGFIVMFVTGILLFYAIPIRSPERAFFRLKLIALVLAGLNAWPSTSACTRPSASGAFRRGPRKARCRRRFAVPVGAGHRVRPMIVQRFDCDTRDRSCRY
jgi:hypothetical protein